ncbi:MAG: BatD family protein [Bacteroidales bacterium]|nr:BatD family protein [Bacteroidales bacterium]
MRRFVCNLLCLLCLLPATLAAQEGVTFQVQAPREVYAGEAFDISFVVNAQGSRNFKAPAFKGFDVLFGPAQSQSTNVSYINGHMQQSFTLSYAYRLRAPESAGEFRFEPATIEVKGQAYQTEAVVLKVLPARTQPANPSRAARNAPGGRPSQPVSGEIGNDDVFLRSFVSKNNPYVGEEVVVTYRLYTAVPVRQYSIYKLPTNKGFWSEEMKTGENEQRETINGRPYVYVDLRKVALFPQEAGKLTIEPLEIEVVAAIQQKRERTGTIFDIFDDPFFDRVTYTQANVRTKPTVLNVRPLPEAGRPADFNGPVGDYKVTFQYDKTKPLKANEAIDFTFTVSGSGNIELIQPPHILFPPDFDVYEPRVNLHKTQDGHIGGQASMEYIVVPRSPGIYRIPAFSFSYFNPQAGQYRTVDIPETALNIREGDGTYVPAGSSEQADGRAAQTLAPLQTHAPHWFRTGRQFFLSTGWWLGLAGLFVLTALSVGLYRRHRAQLADPIGLRNKRAYKEARRCLRKGHLYMTQNRKNDFYIELSQALWGFLSRKFNIPVSDLSMARVREVLHEKGISEASADAFIQTLEHCEYERFAPQGNSRISMADLHAEALEVISSIIKELKA